MDLLGACRAFVSVSEHGSFTVGADAARMSQSVASRRVAALEERFGERLFERTSRRAVLTPFGRAMLPAARQLVQTADVLLHEAEAAKRKPWRLAVPGTCSTAGLAHLVAEARGHGVTLDLRVDAARSAQGTPPRAAGARRVARGAAGRGGMDRAARAGRCPGSRREARLPRDAACRPGPPSALPAVSGSSRRTTCRTSVTR